MTDMDRARDELRSLMMAQPTTGGRETYSDGFAQGLAHAIDRIDAFAAERPGVETGDAAKKIELWFFRDCNAGTRRCLFALFDMPLEEIRNDGTERLVLRHILASLAPPPSASVEGERSPAQYFFEVGFGACWAEAFVKNGSTPPFPLTDAAIERAWAIAGEAHDDPEEFDRYLALAAAPPIPATCGGEFVALVEVLRTRANWFVLNRDKLSQNLIVQGRVDGLAEAIVALNPVAALSPTPDSEGGSK